MIEEVRAQYHSLTKRLIREGITISAMESATSGQIASLITDTEGASAIFPGGLVTYCNEAKVSFGVPQEVLDAYYVYSLQTAEAMATACRKLFATNIGIGVTGTMGNPDPANPEDSVPGEVYLGLNLNGRIRSRMCRIEPQESRLLYKMAVADMMFQFLTDALDSMPAGTLDVPENKAE